MHVNGFELVFKQLLKAHAEFCPHYAGEFLFLSRTFQWTCPSDCGACSIQVYCR